MEVGQQILERIQERLDLLDRGTDASGWPRWMDLRRAAAYCCSNPKHLRGLIAAGKLRGFKVGEIMSIEKPSNRKLHIDRLELDELILSNNGDGA